MGVVVMGRGEAEAPEACSSLVHTDPLELEAIIGPHPDTGQSSVFTALCGRLGYSAVPPVG